MKKKVIVLMMCAVLCFGITACGKKTKDTSAEPTAEPTVTEEIKELEPTKEGEITKELESSEENKIITDAKPTAEPTKKEEAAKAAEPTKKPNVTVTPEGKNNTEEADKQTSGIIEGKNYSSEEFKFSITVPENYVIFDETTSLNVIYESVKLMYDSVDSMMNVLDTMGIKYLFVATTTKPLSIDTVANVIAQAYPVSLIPGTLEEVLQATMDDSSQQLKELGAEPEMSKPEIQKIDDNNIGVAKSKILLNGDTMYQQYICFERGDNRVMLSVTYYTEEEGKEIEDMIQTIKITK